MGGGSVPALSSADPLIGIGDDLRLVLWNRGAEQLTGYPAEEVLGAACWQVVAGVGELDENVCRSDCEIAARVAAGGEVPPATVRIRTAAGRRRAQLSTLSVGCPPDDRWLIHVIHPLPEQPAASAHNHGNNRRRHESAPPTTPRQQEVLQLLAQGFSTKEVAERLTLATPTVRNHVAGLLRAFGCHSRVELLAEARRLRMI
ncbi:MAG TPA: LuxR C-terminal-related transcriptional regulator [Gaiellaceae bacterium]|nr:LuxR C-terminal-related transcriptional regulator [Gaiellaceae bacterium]